MNNGAGNPPPLRTNPEQGDAPAILPTPPPPAPPPRRRLHPVPDMSQEEFNRQLRAHQPQINHQHRIEQLLNDMQQGIQELLNEVRHLRQND